MGREIRRVPKGWQHPKDRDGYIPMYDKTADEAWREWLKDFEEFKADPPKGYPPTHAGHVQWAGRPPDPERHRPEFDGEATHYQIYETVSEGTPASPVFETLDQMRVWLIGQGHSKHAADRFIELEWAPSMFILDDERGISVSGVGIDAFDSEPE